MKMTKSNKRVAIASLISCAALLLALVQNSSLPISNRRMDAYNHQVEQSVEYYKMFLSEDVSEGLQEMQKLLRIRKECELPPVKDEPSAGEEIPVGFVKNPDSHITIISCVEAHYRIPASSVQNIENPLVFGVLSGGKESKNRRDSIRKTWGKGNTVFFIVAGLWEEVEEEYNAYSDILWVDQPEELMAHPTNSHQGALPFKTETFLIAMNDLVVKENSNVEYFFKTDDNCYIDVDYLKEQIISENKKKTVDYWGKCIENSKPVRDEWNENYTPYRYYPYNYFPTYCVGAGYVLSPTFLKCAVNEGHVKRSPYMRNEANTVGLLAEKCGFQPSLKSLSIELNTSENVDTAIAVHHDVKTTEEMSELHMKNSRKLLKII